MPGGSKPLNKTETIAMTYDGNGIYSARYTTGNKGGKITFIVYKERTTGVPVYGYFYSNPDWAGVPSTSTNMTEFNMQKTNVATTQKTSGSFSSKQVCYYKRTSDFSTTLYVNAKNCDSFYIDYESVIENMCNSII